MYFLIPVVLRVVFANVITTWLIKKASGEQGRMRRFVLQFATASALAAALAPWSFSLTFWLIAGIGFLNGLAAYCQWRAIDISLSKTSLFTWGDDAIAIILAMWLLGESKIITLPMGAGLVLSLVAIVLFAAHDAAKKRAAGANGHRDPKLYLWIGAYSVVWGVASFLQRYFALEGVSLTSFLHGWYWGAFAAALILYSAKMATASRTGRHEPPKKVVGDVVLAVALGAGIVTSLSLGYWAFQIAPLVVVQPVFLVAEMVFPALIGLIGFSERKAYDRYDWTYFALGACGIVLLALGFVFR